MSLTEDKLLAYLRETGDADTAIARDTPLFSTGAIDSVGMMSLIAFVERETGLNVRAEDVTLDNFDTAERILRFADTRS